MLEQNKAKKNKKNKTKTKQQKTSSSLRKINSFDKTTIKNKNKIN